MPLRRAAARHRSSWSDCIVDTAANKRKTLPARQRCRALANDLRGAFVGAQALKRGMANFAVGGPLGEGHRRDQLRLDPVHAAQATNRARCERAVGLLERIELRAQRLGRGLGETGADLAGENQPIAASWTPTSSAPSPTRAPSGSVNPPMTNSCWAMHFVFSHSVPRPGR